MNPNRDTIYVDVDDEITGIIDKVQSSDKKIVALVLPKRADVLQSIVNMKLLKRTAGTTKKNVVLITSEHKVLPLAGAVGLHVAKSLQSKPYVPEPPAVIDPSAEAAVVEASDETIDPKAPVGKLAGDDDAEETIVVDNDAVETTTKDTKKSKLKKIKGFKIPNFESFRLRLFLIAGGGLLLLIFWIWAAFMAPRAKITITTNTSSVLSNIEFTANTASTEVDVANKTLPASLKEIKKTDSEKVPATGEKDKGTKAVGTATLTNCNRNDATITVPAGTELSGGGLIFLTNEAVTIPPSNFTGGGNCKNDSNKKVGVTAQNAGTKYNVAARSYTVSAFSSISAEGSDMTGGTSLIVKIVSDDDVAKAKQTMVGRGNVTGDELLAELRNQGLFGLVDTLTTTDPAINVTPKVGDEATEATVTAETTYSMLGVKEDDLKKLIEDDVNKQIDTSQQVILDHGLVAAIFRVVDKKSPIEVKLSLQVLAYAGPQIDTEALKKEVAGKKRGDVQSLIQNRPGIKEVRVDYSPFWVYSTPKSAKKITIVIEKPADATQ